MKAYANRSLTAAEVITELVAMAKALRAEHERGAQLGLRGDELAFYDASAKTTRPLSSWVTTC
jgi:type I restriction enzyme, R subunit